MRLAPRLRDSVLRPSILAAILSASALALLLTPAVWAAIPVIQNTTAFTAIAGPSQGGRDSAGTGAGGFGGIGGTDTVDPALISYLEAHQGSAKYLVATPSSMSADGIILATNKPVMAMGGFSGSDPILTTSQLATLVSNGTIRFFLLNAPRAGRQIPSQVLNRIPVQYRNAIRNGNFGGFGGQQTALTSWVTQHCTTVPASLWQSTTSAPAGGGFGQGGGMQLYECAVKQS